MNGRVIRVERKASHPGQSHITRRVRQQFSLPDVAEIAAYRRPTDGNRAIAYGQAAEYGGRTGVAKVASTTEATVDQPAGQAGEQTIGPVPEQATKKAIEPTHTELPNPMQTMLPTTVGLQPSMLSMGGYDSYGGYSAMPFVPHSVAGGAPMARPAPQGFPMGFPTYPASGASYHAAYPGTDIGGGITPNTGNGSGMFPATTFPGTLPETPLHHSGMNVSGAMSHMVNPMNPMSGMIPVGPMGNMGPPYFGAYGPQPLQWMTPYLQEPGFMSSYSGQFTSPMDGAAAASRPFSPNGLVTPTRPPPRIVPKAPER